jgi:hypothetical protein
MAETCFNRGMLNRTLPWGSSQLPASGKCERGKRFMGRGLSSYSPDAAPLEVEVKVCSNSRREIKNKEGSP